MYYGSFEIGGTTIFDYHWDQSSNPIFNFADTDSRNLYYDGLEKIIIFRNYPFTPENLTFGVDFSIDYAIKMLTYQMYETPIVHYIYDPNQEPAEPEPPEKDPDAPVDLH